MRKGLFSQFRVRGYSPGDTLQPGESMSVEILFVPTQRGHDTDQVVIRYAGQNAVVRYVRVLGRGAGADIDISHPTLAFIPEIAERVVTLANRTANPITLTSAAFSAGAPFTTSAVFPVVIPPADSITIGIRHTGGLISGSDELLFEVTPCAATTSVRLVSYQGTATVFMKDVRVDPRLTAELPIVANITENVQYNGVRPLEVKMQVYQRHFYADSVRVEGGDGELVSQTVDGDIRTITVRMNAPFKNRENVVAYAIGRAGIAEFDSSVVTFDTSAVGFGGAVTTGYKTGLLRIANPNPNRHVLVSTGPVIRSVSPLPATDGVTVEVTSERQSLATLRIVDAQGTTIAMLDLAVGRGRTTTHMDVSTFVPGVYTMILSSPTSSHAQSVVVVRP